MKRIVFALILLATSMSEARNQNCDVSKEAMIAAAMKLAPQRVAELNQSISLELDPKTRRDNLDPNTIAKLRGAHKKLECIGKKVVRLKFECTNEANYFTAKTLPMFGKEVKLANRFFDLTDQAQASVLVHEASHKCGTNDSFYFGGKYTSLNEVTDLNYYNTASTYNKWLDEGFCVPGYSCR